MEKEMDLDISPLCDRNTINIPQSQIGFITYIIEPTFALLSGKQRIMPNKLGNP